MNLPGFPDDGIDLPDIPDFELPDVDPKLVFGALDESIPFLLLPVRLETRFYHNPERLRIRIYPDQIHINSHQTQLSDAELKLGQHFWEKTWHRGLGRASNVFNRLSQSLGVWRAAWVMDSTKPMNIDEIGSGQPLFPTLKASNRTVAPARITLMPHRWFAIGILNGEVMFEDYGNIIPPSLRFAPFRMQDGDDVDRWMVDFGLALDVGMALEIRLNGSKSTVATNGLDELIVLGARFDDPDALAESLEETLQSHYYTRGFDFVPQGTPTNNTENVRSPWQWNSADSNDVFQRSIRPEPALSDSSRERFASVLGLNADGIIARTSYGDVAETANMEAMNLALWYIMWGEYLRYVLNDGENAPIPDSTIDWLRDWFVDHVRGGANYPAFQIGSMPYGILPIQLQPVPLDARSNTDYVQTILWQLRQGWEQSLQNVPHLDPTATASSTDDAVTTDLEQANENLISLLSSHPHPVRFFSRQLDNLREGLSALFFDPVEWYELEISLLLDDLRESNSFLAAAIENHLEDPFESLDEQKAYFESLLDDVDGNNENIVNAIILLLDAHARRIAPLHDLGLPPIMDVLSEITPNPEHFYFNFYETATEWGNLPLVQSEDASHGGTTVVYLDWLHDYARGTVSGSGPEGLPDPVPLLFQLLKKSIDRANQWDGGPLTDFDDFLGGIDHINRLDTVSLRVNATEKLTRNTQRLSQTTALLNSLLKESTNNVERQALASVPQSVYTNASKQLREYQQVTQRTSTEVGDLIDILDELIEIADDIYSIPGTSSTWIPVKPGERARQIADAITQLATITPEELELRMTETLGLAMHRLDAWITAYAEQRVDTLRSKYPTGIQIGGYGWVENLRPDKAGDSPTQGYIHAPSMTHAAMAAVLRSGYSAFSDGSSTSPLSVDLRSDRVRVASWMMDGVRQGQRINDLLGYRFERYLHDHNLDVWIQPVRDAVEKEGETEYSDSTALVMVDGLALLELWNEGKGNLKSLVEPPLDDNDDPRKFDEISSALDQLVWITDSMADLAVAESVHAILQGDYERASAVQNAAALGDVPPPELRSILTPNSGMTITHKVLILPQANNGSWIHDGRSIRAAMEPALESWVTGLIVNPERIFYQVSGGVDDPVERRTLANLQLTALDAIYLAPIGGIVSGSGLGARIAYDYRQRHATTRNPIADIHIDADIPVGDEEITLYEFSLLAKSIRQIVSSARAATPNDFVLSSSNEGEDTTSVYVGNLMRKALELLEIYRDIVTELKNPQANIEQVLLTASAFNLPQAIPAASDPKSLRKQAASVYKTAEKRIIEARNALKRLQQDEQQESQSTDKHLRVAKQIIATIMGRDWPVTMQFTMPVASELIHSETDIADNDTHNTAPVMGWLLKMARVRPMIGTLRELITTTEALQDRPLFPFWVAQVPYHPGEPWAGIAQPNDDGNDRLSMILTTNGDLDGLPTEIGGLILDQWTERIPFNYEMTGLTFHFDAPTSRPPQALLLTIPPANQSWSFGVALDTVREAFAMARLRAVAPETLGDYGQQIPAVYLKTNLDTTGSRDDEQPLSL